MKNPDGSPSVKGVFLDRLGGTLQLKFDAYRELTWLNFRTGSNPKK
jgi:hypothetical protein